MSTFNLKKYKLLLEADDDEMNKKDTMETPTDETPSDATNDPTANQDTPDNDAPMDDNNVPDEEIESDEMESQKQFRDVKDKIQNKLKIYRSFVEELDKINDLFKTFEFNLQNVEYDEEENSIRFEINERDQTVEARSADLIEMKYELDKIKNKYTNVKMEYDIKPITDKKYVKITFEEES